MNKKACFRVCIERGERGVKRGNDNEREIDSYLFFELRILGRKVVFFSDDEYFVFVF